MYRDITLIVPAAVTSVVVSVGVVILVCGSVFKIAIAVPPPAVVRSSRWTMYLLSVKLSFGRRCVSCRSRIFGE